MKKKIYSIVIIVLMIAGLMTVTTNPVLATNYYVNASAGNDNNNGTGTGTPWQSLSKVNSVTFQAGDIIYFHSGSTWLGTLKPLGSGSSSAQITIDKYGTGSGPLINGNGNESAVELFNQQYWTIQNLRVTNPDPDPNTVEVRNGIKVTADGGGLTLRNIRLLNNEVYDIRGTWKRNVEPSFYFNSAIFIRYGENNPTSNFENLRIENNNIHDVYTSGIMFLAPSNYSSPSTWSYGTVIRGNTVLKTGADGIVVGQCISPLLEYNVIKDAGINGTSDTEYIAGLWGGSCTDAVFQYNEVARTRKFLGDGQAFDTDGGARGTWIFQYNYSYGNEGGVLLLVDFNNSNLDKVIFRYNISQGDNAGMMTLVQGKADVYNNVFYNNGTNTYIEGVGGNTFRNNIFVGGGASSYGNGNTFDYNSYYGHTGPSDAHKITANPQMVNPGTAGEGLGSVGGYKLLNTSPCLNAGVLITNNGGKDYWGNSVSSSSAPNIGAYNGVGENGGSSTNLVSNPGFEADNGYTQTPGSWTSYSTSSGGYNVDFVEGTGGSGGPHSGNYKLVHWQGAGWGFVSTYQLKTGLSNGTYTLRAWVKASGNISGYMYAGNFGGTANIDIAVPSSSAYQQISTPVTVTNGQCEFGFWSSSSGGGVMSVDDVELVPAATNFVSNPGFEADNGYTQTPGSWTSYSTSSGGYNVDFVEGTGGSGGPHSGNYKLVHWQGAGWGFVSTYQLKTGLSNGTYTLRAWVKASGNISGYMYAGNFGGTANIDIAVPSSSAYQQISTPVTVTNGQCEFGFWSSSSGGGVMSVDDVELVPAATNFVSNPGFEADNGYTQTPGSWTSYSTSSGGYNVDFVEGTGGSGGPHSGNYKLVHWQGAGWGFVSTYQLKTGLSNGTYTLRAWVKASGNISGYMYAGNFGGTTNIDIAVPSSSAYQQISTPVTVTNGQCEFGFWSSSSGGGVMSVDDVELVSGTGTAARIPNTRQTPSIKDDKPITLEQGLKVFPNPSSNGNFTVQFTGLEGKVNIKLVNINGQIVKDVITSNSNSYLYNGLSLPSGIYFIIATDKANTYKKKIIINK